MKVKELKEQLNLMNDEAEVYIPNLIIKNKKPEKFDLYIYGYSKGNLENPEVNIHIQVENYFKSYDDIHDGEFVKLIQNYVKQKYPSITMGYSG